MKSKFLSQIIILLSLIFTSSCAELFKRKEIKPLDYINGSVKMNYKKFFDGEIKGFAIKQGEDGSILSSKTVLVKGQWDGNKGVVKFNYVYNNGKKDSRTWLITLNSDGTFDAIGHDIIKPAHGRQIENAAQSTYSLKEKDANNIKSEVFYEDRMYLVDKDSMMLISNYKKKNNGHISNNDSFGKIITSLTKIHKEEQN